MLHMSEHHRKLGQGLAIWIGHLILPHHRLQLISWNTRSPHENMRLRAGRAYTVTIATCLQKGIPDS